MKKYFLMLATMAAALFVSCKGGPGTDKPDPDKPKEDVVLSDATYYGEKISSDIGMYSLTFTKGSDKVRVDLLSAVSTDADKAKILGGKYQLGSTEKPATTTYFVAESGESEDGTLFWNNGTPVLVTGGTVTVQVATGSAYTITLNLQAGDTTIDWQYSGIITFVNKYVVPKREPRTGNPSDYMVSYEKDYNLASTPLTMIRIAMTSLEYPNTMLQLFMTIPYTEDYENITIPTGTFEIEKNPQEPYKIIAGVKDAGYMYSYEAEYTAAGNPKSVVLINSGSVTISDEGGKFHLSAKDMNGEMFSSATGALMGTPTDMVYTLDLDEIPMVENYYIPISTLERGKNIEATNDTFTKIDIDPRYFDEAGTMIIWRMIMTSEGITLKQTEDWDKTGNLTISGEGEFLSIQFFTSGSAASPEGTYEFNDTYPNAQDFKVGTAVPGVYGLGYDLLGMTMGTWYAEIGVVDGQPGVKVNAGAMAGMGSIQVKLNEESKIMTLIIEMYDRYNNKISGTLDYQFTTSEPEQASDTANGVLLTQPTRFVSAPAFPHYSMPNLRISSMPL